MVPGSRNDSDKHSVQAAEASLIHLPTTSVCQLVADEHPRPQKPALEEHLDGRQQDGYPLPRLLQHSRADQGRCNRLGRRRQVGVRQGTGSKGRPDTGGACVPTACPPRAAARVPSPPCSCAPLAAVLDLIPHPKATRGGGAKQGGRQARHGRPQRSIGYRDVPQPHVHHLAGGLERHAGVLKREYHPLVPLLRPHARTSPAREGVASGVCADASGCAA